MDFGTDQVHNPRQFYNYETINDTYKVDSIKNMARQKRGASFTNFNITVFEKEYATK